MGNAQSNKEANGTAVGGFLGLLGSVFVSIMCAPVAAIAIPVGVGAYAYGMTTLVKYDNKPHEEKKKGTTSDFVGGLIMGTTFGGVVQVGANYKDNDNRPHIHYCPTNTNPVAMREQKESKDLYEKQMKIEQSKQDKENLNIYMRDTFMIEKSHMSHTYINYTFNELCTRVKKNFDQHGFIHITNISSFLKMRINLVRFDYYLDHKIMSTINTLKLIMPIILKEKKEKKDGLYPIYNNLFSATVYAFNALECAKMFQNEMTSIAYAPYACQIDENLQNYCSQMKSALINFINACHDSYKRNRTIAKIENTVDKIYDQVAEAKAMEKPMCKKYGIYIDNEKYKLNLEGKIKKIVEFVRNNKKINTYDYHEQIYNIVKDLNELLQD